MKLYTLSRTTIVHADIATTWRFFSDPRNLARITPATMSFVIREQDKLPAEVYTGLLIPYTIKPLLGIPMKWLTEIKDVDEPNCFVDEQKKGPYAYWHHRHTFEPYNGGSQTLMKDTVTYALPYGILGRLMHWLVVARKLEGIFNFRTTAIEKLFPKAL